MGESGPEVTDQIGKRLIIGGITADYDIIGPFLGAFSDNLRNSMPESAANAIAPHGVTESFGHGETNPVTARFRSGSWPASKNKRPFSHAWRSP